MINRSIQRLVFKKEFKISYLEKVVLKWLKRLEIKKIIWLDNLDDFQLYCFQPEDVSLVYNPKR